MRMSSPSIPSLPPLSALGKSLLAAFASPFSQANRLFKMRFADSSDIAPELLLPYHLRGVEQISGTYLYQVEAFSPSVRLRPKQFNGQPVMLSLRTDDGAERVVTGVVTAFGQIGSDGGTALYSLRNCCPPMHKPTWPWAGWAPTGVASPSRAAKASIWSRKLPPPCAA